MIVIDVYSPRFFYHEIIWMNKNVNKLNHDGHLELIFDNKWKYISSIRNFIQNIINELLVNKEKAEMISLAANELIENAVKYHVFNDDCPDVRLKLIHKTSEKILLLEVKNCSSDKNIDILKKEIEAISKSSPDKSYLKKIFEVSKRTDGKSMLGLSRVRFESGCDLSIHTDNGIVTIQAIFYL